MINNLLYQYMHEFLIQNIYYFQDKYTGVSDIILDKKKLDGRTAPRTAAMDTFR